MEGTGDLVAGLQGFRSGQVEEVGAVAAEQYLVFRGIGDAVFVEEGGVEAAFARSQIDSRLVQKADCVVVAVPEETQKKVVRTHGVGPRAHGFFAGVAERGKQFVGKPHFRLYKTHKSSK